VEFDGGGTLFQPRAFRDAVGDAGVDLLTLQIDACGIVEEREDGRSFIAGRNRFALGDSLHAPVGRFLCASGWLNDPSNPSRIVLSGVQPAEH
jgi:hypothetical protein